MSACKVWGFKRGLSVSAVSLGAEMRIIVAHVPTVIAVAMAVAISRGIEMIVNVIIVY